MHTMEGDALLLDIPAATAFLPVLRTAAAGLATRLNFELAAIEDLRVAVDEAAGMLMMVAPGTETSLRCRFDVSDTDLAIAIGAQGVGPLPDRQSFSWRVLDTLADSVSIDVQDEVTTVKVVQGRPSESP